jgi:hypothetical protein
MKTQSSLGREQTYNVPMYDQTQIGHVTSIKDYKKYGRIGVIFLDHSQPVNVWAIGCSMDREPVEGDMVLVGFIQGRPDSPYMINFVRNESYTSNFVVVDKDKILIQFTTDLEDIREHLLDDAKKPQRMKIELKGDGVYINGYAAARKTDVVWVDVPEHGRCYGEIDEGADTSGDKK